MVRRVFVERRYWSTSEAAELLEDLQTDLELEGTLEKVRIYKLYDVEGLDDEEDFDKAKREVFGNPQFDLIVEILPKKVTAENALTFVVEPFPGQYDQRADSAAQACQLITGGERPIVRTAKVFYLEGYLTEDDYEQIKKYIINPLESYETTLELPETLEDYYIEPQDVEILTNFNRYDEIQLKNFLRERGLAMSLEDLQYCQEYFIDVEKRPPTITELKVIDTYWSDHCRHTTFNTAIDSVTFEEGKYSEEIKNTFKKYLEYRQKLYFDEHPEEVKQAEKPAEVPKKEKDITLMDLGTIAAKVQKAEGTLKNVDESEEINACSIKVKADVDGQKEDWLVMFKNETHNHPTEIEPYGGAATCLGGAIRDPLSGRTYVYQAMRITGAADPRKPVSETLPGKLPQKKIVREAAQGYSSYGNQIGLATGYVREIYHEGYLAKRMEIGAVIGAAPAENVVRSTPVAGDVVLLVGGRTGRDGIGGATGSSKVHTSESLTKCGAEVQKGNPPTERKIQRLFRNPKASRLIKRCNDFGAGGVAVAVGELAAGLDINLDALKTKYEGLDGTELAISESQERMAVVVAPNDVETFIKLADEENLEAYKIAVVTEKNKLVMHRRGQEIVSVSRKFFDTNGVKQHVTINVAQVENYSRQRLSEDIKTSWIRNLQKLNVCSQKGLVERFDSTVGAGTVLMPFGGKNQLTPAEGMAAKLPVEGETKTATVMTFGFDAKISAWSPYHGAIDAVTSSLAKLTAIGADFSKAYLTFQEYFERLGKDPIKWGKPFAALLGAFKAQMNFGVAAIGGKDSMSGTYENLNVPPTLVSFAVAVVDADKIISPEFKAAGHKVYLVECPRDEFHIPNFRELRKKFTTVNSHISAGKIVAAMSISTGGIAEAVSKMTIGNDIGFKFEEEVRLFEKNYGSLILEAADGVELDFHELGETIDAKQIEIGNVKISLDEIKTAWTAPLEKIFPTKAISENPKIPPVSYRAEFRNKAKFKFAQPRVFIPVFPGTNCEYDSARVWRFAGAKPNILVVRNLTPKAIEESVSAMVDAINNSQIIMIPGGFSAGDEPDGSGKFIAAMFRNPRIANATMEFIKNRDGLILGICNGFQALVKLGLLPYGEIRDIGEDSAELTYNTIGRHVSQMVRTRVASNLSPWLANNSVGDIHTVAVSHGEGRFVAEDFVLKKLIANGQIATQYVDFDDEPTNEFPFNPNGSIYAVEGITSADGRIFGKMGHSERIGENVCKNVPGNKNQRLFEAGVNYFS